MTCTSSSKARCDSQHIVRWVLPAFRLSVRLDCRFLGLHHSWSACTAFDAWVWQTSIYLSRPVPFTPFPSTSWVLSWCHHLTVLHSSITVCYIGVIVQHSYTEASPSATLCRLSSVKHAPTTGMLRHWTAATQQHLARLSQMRRARRKEKPPSLRGYVSQVGQPITACFALRSSTVCSPAVLLMASV